ncbi:HK97-gp10 family putative phage morphogenesis protein [Pseudoduganella sp. UC29_106]|uniref:HK97-gp10 family putative phage morphogenesis protein n=1 Tax=Pseudoduganella sp. UC29_106 TaxID=3374553 RepID=UPI003757DDBC
MTDSITVKMTGIPEFSARLRALGIDMERKIVRAGALAAGIVFRNAARENAPSLKPNTRRKDRTPGALKKSIYATRSKSKSKPGLETIVVAARAGSKTSKKGVATAFYWRWVEDGHVARGPGGKLKGGNRSRALQRSRLKAGGKFVPGVAFLRRAFQGKQDQAVAAFNKRIEARIAKAQKALNER